MTTVANTLLAAVVAAILYFQWRTAHQRAVLDLFDRRLDVFADLETAVGEVFRSAQVSADTFKFVSARRRARFLFGKDVNDYLEKLHKDFAWRFTYTDDTIDADGERERRLEEKTAVLLRIANFSNDAIDIFAPYMRMDQKLPSTWLPF
jgi:hypothetical protein